MPDPKHSEFRADEGENEETWLLTYVDMVSLLLALFVILFSFSSLDAKKFEQALNQIQASLGGPLNATLLFPQYLLDMLAFDLGQGEI